MVPTALLLLLLLLEYIEASLPGAAITNQEHDYRGLNRLTEEGLQNTSDDDTGSDNSGDGQRPIDYADLDALQENRRHDHENFGTLP